MTDDTSRSRSESRHESQLLPAPITVGVYGAQWIKDRSGLAVRTVELYDWLLNRYIDPELGSLPLTLLTPAIVRGWNSGHAREHPTTAAKAYRLLSTIMRTAVSDEIVTRNPCQVRGAAVERAPERPIATTEEVELLARAMPDPLKIAVHLAAWCQLRRGEVRGLRRCDIDLSQMTLKIRKTRTNMMSGQMVVKEPKTNAGKRTVAIPSNIVGTLDRHLRAFVGESDEALVIDASDRQLGVAWRQARQVAGRPDLRFHDLRHSGLTWAAGTGASLAELMRRAGHVSQSAALRYQHATDQRDRVLADGLALLAGQSDAP